MWGFLKEFDGKVCTTFSVSFDSYIDNIHIIWGGRRLRRQKTNSE